MKMLKSKQDYYNFSKNASLPSRCPILCRCERRAETILIASRMPPLGGGGETIDLVQPAIQVIGEPPKIISGNNSFTANGMCPEVNLFDSGLALMSLSGTPATSGDYDKYRTPAYKILETGHFSECAEYSFFTVNQEAYSNTATEEKVATGFSPIDKLKKLAERLPRVARQLRERRKDSGQPRPTIEVNDEYDVQDLIHAILQVDFDDIRPEEWCPSHAGSSKRSDFLLKSDSIVVEVKMTRPGRGQKQIGEELIIDIANYRQHKDCKHLFCLIWDPQKIIENPTGLRADLEKSNGGFVTVAIV